MVGVLVTSGKGKLFKFSANEMTILIGGLRTLVQFLTIMILVFLPKIQDATTTFVNLLDIDISWEKSHEDENIFEGRDNRQGSIKWRATSIDLLFGSNSQLRAISEAFAADDAGGEFVSQFGKAWAKVMNLDRFDLM